MIDRIEIIETDKRLSVFNRNEIDTVTVVVRGFTCSMSTDTFFKIVDEAFKW